MELVSVQTIDSSEALVSDVPWVHSALGARKREESNREPRVFPMSSGELRQTKPSYKENLKLSRIMHDAEYLTFRVTGNDHIVSTTSYPDAHLWALRRCTSIAKLHTPHMNNCSIKASYGIPCDEGFMRGYRILRLSRNSDSSPLIDFVDAIGAAVTGYN